MSNGVHEALTLVTAPTAEPLSAQEAKDHMRVDITTDDELIEALIGAARRKFEADTGRALCTRTYDLTLDGWPCGDSITLPYPPLQSVTSITYYDTSNASATFASSSYFVDTASLPGRIVLGYGQSWPSVTLRPANGVVVRFVTGAGAASQVADSDKQALLLLIAHWYEHREAIITGTISKPVELAYESLVWTERVNFGFG